jgi:hypothetical protein
MFYSTERFSVESNNAGPESSDSGRRRGRGLAGRSGFTTVVALQGFGPFLLFVGFVIFVTQFLQVLGLLRVGSALG